MKINELDLTNVTRYKQSHMDLPAKISVLLGHNAEGKTTIADAIALGLTGACERTDKAGKGQENLVSSGEKQGAIKLTVSNNGAEPLEVTRYVPGELAIEGQHGNKTQLQANLCEYLGVETSVLSAALSTTAFIDAKPSDQKGLLFGLLGLSFERADVLEKILDEMSTQLPLVSGAAKALNAAPANLFTGEASTFDLLHGHFYTLRRDYKRDLKALGEPEQPKLTDEPPTAEIVELLEDLRKQRSALQKQEAANAATLTMVARLAEEIRYLEDRIEDAGDPEAAVAELEKVRGKINGRDQERAAKLREAEAYTSVAAAFEAGSICPVGEDAGLEVACGMAKTKREKLIAELESKAELSRGEAGDVAKQLIPLYERKKALKVEAEKPSRVDIEAQIEQKRAELAELPNPVPVGPTTAAEIATLTDRIANGEQVLAAANREEGARQEREKQQEKRAGLEATVEVLEALVDVLSPSGLPGKILSQTIGPIEERANKRLQELTGGRYSLHLVLDPDFAILVDHDGVTTDLKRLSSSERFRVGLVLQESLVHLSGLRFMIVDNLDILDGHNRDLAMDALVSMAPELDQVIVLATIGPGGAHPLNPPIPDVALYLLEDGQLREVE